MSMKNPIHELRQLKGLSQDELAETVFVTRQAGSRWENGATTPNTETLKLLSKLPLKTPTSCPVTRLCTSQVSSGAL